MKNRIYLGVLIWLIICSLLDLFWVVPFSGLLSILAIAGGIFLVFKMFLETHNKYSQVLSGSGVILSVYWAICCIAIAAGFSSIFMDLARQNSQHFNGLIDGVSAFYFSVNTFATVGIGDIHPLTKIAKLLVSLEIMSAIMVLPIIVSSTVAWIINRRMELQNEVSGPEDSKSIKTILSRVK